MARGKVHEMRACQRLRNKRNLPLGAPGLSIGAGDGSQGTNDTVSVERYGLRHLTTVWTRAAVAAARGFGFLAVLAAMVFDLAHGQNSLAAFRAIHLKLRNFSGH